MGRYRQLPRCILIMAGLATVISACGPQQQGTPVPFAPTGTVASGRATATAAPSFTSTPALAARPSPTSERESSPVAVGDKDQVIFTIPAGEDGDGAHYDGVGQVEMQRTGPAGFTVAPDGTFWVLDTEALRLLHFGRNGERLRTVDLAAQPRSLIDIEATTTDVYVLDAFPTPPLVLRLASDGILEETYPLPEEFRLETLLTGIAVTDAGHLLIEQDGGIMLSRLLDDQGRIDPVRVDGFSYRGRLYSARPAGIHAPDNRVGYLTLGDLEVEVKMEHFLGGLRIAGFAPDGSVWVRLEEVTLESEMAVDQTVRLYSPEGNLLGMARVPVAEQYTYVGQPVAIGPGGEAYALLTQPDHVEIRRLAVRPSLEPLLPPAGSPTP